MGEIVYEVILSECFNMEEEDALDSKVRSFLYYLILVRCQRGNPAVKEEGWNIHQVEIVAGLLDNRRRN